jgi:hypothetical protein
VSARLALLAVEVAFCAAVGMVLFRLAGPEGLVVFGFGVQALSTWLPGRRRR